MWLTRLVVFVALLGLFGVAGLSASTASAAPLHSARHSSGTGPVINWDSSMIYSGQNNNNPEGPVGEQAKINGTGFVPGTSVNIVLAPGDSNFDASVCQNSSADTVATDISIQSDGTFTNSFTWPATASSGQYSVCALDPNTSLVVSNVDSGPFTVLSGNPPAIQLSSTQLNLGDSVTITGANFDPSQTVNVLIATCHNCGASPIASTTTNSDANGNFTVTLNIPSNASPGSYVATAFTQNGVLDVGLIGGAVSLTVSAPATATPNPTATAMATATNTTQATTPTTQATTASGGSSTGSNTTGTNTGGSDNTPYIIGIVVAVIVLLIALAAIIFLFVRRRGATGPTGGRRAPPPASEGGYGGYGGYGASVSAPSGAYTPPSGSYTPPGGYTPITGTTGANTPPDWRVMPTWDGSQTAGLPGSAPPATATPQQPVIQNPGPGVPNPGDDAPTIPGSY